jgi:1-acyl-sn-glycerol-3-phosphate acyltransferase
LNLSLFKFARIVIRLIFVALWVFFGLFCVGLVYRVLTGSARAKLNRFWSGQLMRLCGVRVVPRGQPLLTGPVLWAANHVSWIDIFVINSVRASSFIAKSEVRAWPLIGWLAAGAGTIFIDRGQRRAIQAVGVTVKACFDRGDSVGLFPEGTTSEGDSVRPFHASLFEPARAAGVPIQPVALKFMHQGKRSPLAAFVGEESLATNLWRVLGAKGLSVEIDFLPPVSMQGPDGLPHTRLETSNQVHAAIAARL